MVDPVQAILGAPQPQQNFLQTINGYQDFINKQQQYRNAVAQEANVQQATASARQAQAISGAVRHSQDMASILALPEAQMPAAAQQKLDAELSTGQISQAQYDAGKDLVGQAAQSGDVSQLKRIASQHILSTLSGAEQIKALSPGINDTPIGGQNVPRITPSPLSLAGGGPAGIATGPGVIDRTIAPGYEHTGDQIIPVGGAQGAPTLRVGASPELAGSVQTITDPTTGLPTVGRNAQFGGLPSGGIVGGSGGAGGLSGSPGMAPSGPPPGGYRLPGAGAQAPQPGGTMGVGGPGQGGMLGGGPISINPQAIQAQGDNYKNFRAALDSQPALKTTEQTLTRAFREQQTAVTGPGADALQALRNRLSTLNAATGGKISQNDIDSANYDELGKDFSQLAGQAGSGAHFAGVAEAIQHGNANLALNRLANSNVTSLLLGQNRQKQLEVALTKDQTSGRDYQAARAKASDLDPRALAIDAMTPTMRAETLKEVSKDPAALKKFWHSVDVGRRAGLITLPAPMEAQAPPTNAIAQGQLAPAPTHAMQGQ